MQKILITGSTAYDVLLGYDGSFTEGLTPEKLEGLSVGYVTPRYTRENGGTGANISWNLKLLGGDPLLVSTVGHDGEDYLTHFKEGGISTDHVALLREYATATAIIATDAHEHQITFFHPGADAHGDWPELKEDIAYAIISPRDVQVMMQGAEWCAEKEISFLFDPGQQVLGFSEDELRRALKASSGVIVNSFEWDLLKDRLGCTEENIALYTPLLIVTRGEYGLTLFTADGAVDFGPCATEGVVNPTGAGDAFRGGLLFGLGSGWNLHDACRLGAAMGSFAVEVDGTQMESVDNEELKSRAHEAYGENLPDW